MASSQDSQVAAVSPPASTAAHIKIMSPSPQLSTPLDFELPLDSTIGQLKNKIKDALDTKPGRTEQRLIYRGRILQDAHTIGSILGASANGEQPESTAANTYTFHLALRPTGESTETAEVALGLSPPGAGGQQTTSLDTSRLRHISEASHRAAQLQREVAENYRSRLQRGVNNIRAEVSSTRASPVPAVVTRVETRISYGPRTGGTLGGDAAANATIPAAIRTTTTRTTTATIRMSSTSTAGIANSDTPPALSAHSPLSANPPSTFTRSPQNPLSVLTAPNTALNSLISSLQSQNLSQMYLLRGPEGQHVLLASSPSSASATNTTPLLSHPVVRAILAEQYLPGESPDSTLQQELDGIPGLEDMREHIVRIFELGQIGLARFGSVRAAGIHTPATPINLAAAQRPAAPNVEALLRQRLGHGAAAVPVVQPPIAPVAQQQQDQQQQQQQQQVQQARPQVNAAEIIRRVQQDGAAHFWLAVRLTMFVVLFGQGGGWRRRIMMGTLALLIFIWQTGLLNEQVNNARALYREIFPAPPPPPPPAPAQQAANGTIPPTPEATAQLLVQQDIERRQTRVRDMVTAVERSLGLFLASLVPGMHERHVRAHEERERERVGGGAAGGADAGVGGNPEGGAGGDGDADRDVQVDDAMGGMFMAGM